MPTSQTPYLGILISYAIFIFSATFAILAAVESEKVNNLNYC